MASEHLNEIRQNQQESWNPVSWFILEKVWRQSICKATGFCRSIVSHFYAFFSSLQPIVVQVQEPTQ